MARPRTPIGEYGKVRIWYDEASGKWRASAYVRLNNGDLKQVKATADTRRRVEALLKLRARERAKLKTGGLIHSRTTVEKLGDFYLDYERNRSVGKKLAPQTIEQYEGLLRKHIYPALRNRQLIEVNTEALADLVLGIAEKHPTQASKVRNVLRNIFRVAVRYSAIDRDPTEGVPTITPPRKEVVVMSAEEIVILRQAVYNRLRKSGRGPRPNGNLAAAYDVMLGSGVRVGECVALRVKDVDLEAGTIDVNGTLAYVKAEGGHVRRPVTKTRSSERLLKLPPFAIEALRSRLARANGPDSPVFATRSGEFMTPTQIRRELREAIATTNLRKELKETNDVHRITPHTLRKTVATAIDRELSAGDASEVLGHSSVGITISHYIAERREAVEVLDVLQLVADAAQVEP